MAKIGIIFDFNGTLLFDGKYHDAAWRIFLQDLTMQDISHKEMNLYVKNKSAKEILEHFTGYELSSDMINQFAEEKERVYRSLLSKDRPGLAPGAEEFLNFLILSRTPVNIASTANIENMNYYFEEYNLGRWFTWEKVVIASGDIPPKPHPDMYHAAMQKIGLEKSETACFEDSEIGIKSAFNAGINHIIAVTGDSKNESLNKRPGVIACIKDYTELNQGLDILGD